MKHAYAIIRCDKFLCDIDDINIESIITVKKIVSTIDRAKNEVQRLNKINNNKGCFYFWKITRLEES